ncbi:MAG: PH domain-containing protein [Erythrobacter sp.]
MSSDGENDPPKTGQPNSARQLFGHKAGAKPWEEPTANGQSTPNSTPTKPSAPAASATASTPYPRDSKYAPRPEPTDSSDPPAAHQSILGEVDDEGELTNLHPNYKLLMRFGAVIGAVILMIVAIIADELVSGEFGIPFGFITGPAVLFALFLIIRIPAARYNARGYQISRDRLRVVRGIMWHSDTVVPFGRVQHIDVDQGPIERAMGIATMTLHTAGSHNASVRLPGLGHELAIEMREEIRAHIKRETL